MGRLKTKWRGPATVDTTRKAYRKILSTTLKEGIRIRVSMRGLGATGALKGYSTRPLKMFPGAKKRRTPARGWGAFHEEGYKQYREELGLTNDIFVFSNTGAAWKDWKAVDPGAGPIEFGFSDGLNSMAADTAVERGRQDMFEPDAKLLDEAVDKALESILTSIYGR